MLGLKHMVNQHQSCHGFYDWYCTWYYTSIVSSSPLYGNQFARIAEHFLFLQQSGYRFESYIKIDIHTIGNATLNSSRIIGDSLTVVLKTIVVLASQHGRSLKP